MAAAQLRYNRVWKYLRNDTGKFKYSLQFRKNVTNFTSGADNGILVMPKVFRRQVCFEMQKKVKLFSGSIAEFLTQSKDPFYKFEDFVNEGFEAKLYYLEDFFNKKKFLLNPEELIFREKYSNVDDDNGKEIKKW